MQKDVFSRRTPPLKCEVTENHFIPAHVLNVAGIRKAGAFIPAHGAVIFAAYPYLIFCGITDVLFAEKGPALKFLHCHVIISPFSNYLHLVESTRATSRHAEMRVYRAFTRGERLQKGITSLFVNDRIHVRPGNVCGIVAA